MAIGKRAMLVQQAGLVWVDDKFEAEWFIETGEWAVPDPKATEGVRAKASELVEEMLKIPYKDRSAWLVEKTSRPAKLT